MEDLSYNLFILALVASGVTSMLYLWAVLGLRIAVRSAATDAGTMTLVGTAPTRGTERTFAYIGLGMTLALLTGAMLSRWIAAERPPLGNMYEYNLALAWGMTLFLSIHQMRFRDPSIGVVGMPAMFLLLVINLMYFPSTLTTLIPALQAERILGIHVATMMMSYAALSISFFAAVLYLIQGPSRRFSRIPSRPRLQEVAEWSVKIGVPMLALGIALGAWWANDAWGRYWGWDPKETSALVTWLIYTAYLHAHGLRGWRGSRSMWLLILGYGAVIFTYFAVNLWISGLHSYAGV